MADRYTLRDAALPRYNIAPGQQVFALCQGSSAEDEKEEAHSCRWLSWGLTPSPALPALRRHSWSIRSARLPHDLPLRSVLRRSRCLLVADGFYEWKWLEASRRQPYYVSLRDGAPFYFAGLWQPGRAGRHSCALLTTSPNSLVGSITDRMPVILDGAAAEAWLDPALDDVDRLLRMLTPYSSNAMTVHQVSPRVDDPRIDDARCIEPYLPLRSFGAESKQPARIHARDACDLGLG